MPLPPSEGDTCGVNNCTGTFQIQPPLGSWDWGCSCHISPPCGYCVGHELRCTDCELTPDEVEVYVAPLVSLDTPTDSCKADNLLRIEPALHFPIGQVFEVPDEFNGTQRGTFYFRNADGKLRGPFMNADEAEFMMKRRIPT